MNTALLDTLDVAWRPPVGSFDASPLGRFAARNGLGDFPSVVARAQADPEWFWAACAEDVGVRWMHPYDEVLDLSDGVEFPHFFRSGQLNWADYSVDRWVDQGRSAAEAIWWEGADGSHRSISYLELKEQIDRAAGAFRALGVGVGDVVAMLLPMVPEAVVTMLAGAKIGAIVVPMFSGYGPEPIRERLQSSGARLLVTCDAFARRGKYIELKRTADLAVDGLDGLRHILLVRRSGVDVPMDAKRDLEWDAVLRGAAPVRNAVALDVETPCLLMYSSGSTGRPKGCVHTHAGLPFRSAQEARHNLGVDERTRLLWVTDMGWVMGSYVVAAALTNGGTAVLFEGLPDWPRPDHLWSVVERSRATVLGISPTAIRALMAHGDEWPRHRDLSSLEVIGSTGEPWNLDPWWWCFDVVGHKRLPIINISGGTETGASIVSNSIHAPIKPAGFSGPGLAMASDVVDGDGKAVRGEVGELVIRRPWPGMTKGFWDGPERYLETYWSRIPGIWVQGDFAYIDKDGFWFLLGRSDDTIMLAGKRVGPAEIESAVVSDELVVEAAAIGVPDPVKGEALVVFAVVSKDADPEQVSARVRDRIARDQGHALVPKTIHIVGALPKTRNGKIMRRIVKAAYLGEDLGDLSALENVDAIAEFTELGA